MKLQLSHFESVRISWDERCDLDNVLTEMDETGEWQVFLVFSGLVVVQKMGILWECEVSKWFS